MNFTKKKVFLTILLLLLALPLISNKFFRTNYDDLDPNTKELLEEYEKFYGKNVELWKNYKLDEKTIAMINKNFLGDFYLINPSEDIKSLCAKEIKMPQNFKIRVYRISKNYPKRFNFILGNFNTKGKNYSILGQENIFYLKTSEESLAEKYSSERFLPLLAHEAFHYYVQEDWDDLTFRGLSYSEDELTLLDREYRLLDKIKDEVEKENSDKILLDSYLKDYLEIMEDRKKFTDSEKLKAELVEETIEGTAQYVEIKAAQVIDYDLGILYFDNTKDVNFSDILPTLKKGQIDQSLIGSHLVYASGALLCFAMDKMNFPNWQDLLMERNKKESYTLYDLISDYYKN